MINKYSADVDFSLRLSGVIEKTVNAFVALYQEDKVDFRLLPSCSDKYVLTLQLERNFDFKSFCRIVESIEYESFDAFVSVTSEIDNCIVDMPDFFLKAIRELPLENASISFIYIG